MNLLLDTHAVLWWFDGGELLSDAARDAIRRASVVYVSAASAWEVAMKSSLGKLELPAPFEDGVERSKFTPLPILFSHAAAVTSLPRHHADPFNRMLIAQSIVENLNIVTHDERFRAYGRAIVWT
jgi:PIN domain nuclease of toxin-antitoxin system